VTERRTAQDGPSDRDGPGPAGPSAGRIGTSRWQVFVRTSLYLLGGSLQKAAYLLLLPFLVAVLTPDEFTRFGLMVSAIAVLTPLFSLNAHLAPGRLYFDYEESHHGAELLFSSLLGGLGLVMLGLSVCVGVLRLSGAIEPVTLGSLEVQLWIALVVVLLVAGDFGLTLIRIRGNAWLYTIVAAVSGFGILVAFLALRGWVRDGFLRGIVALAVGRGAAAAISLAYAARYLRGARFRWGMLGRSLAFSWPTTIHLLALWMVSHSGRWIGSLYLTLEGLAPYMLVSQIVGAMMMVGRALFEARLPDIGRAFAGRHYREGRRIILVTAAAGLGIVALAYVALYVLLFVLKLPLPAGYAPTPLLVLLAGVANLFDIFYVRGVSTLSALKKTGVQAAATLLASVVTVATSFALVGRYGDHGLAVAVAIGLGVQALASNVAARHQLRKASADPRDH